MAGVRDAPRAVDGIRPAHGGEADLLVDQEQLGVCVHAYAGFEGPASRAVDHGATHREGAGGGAAGNIDVEDLDVNPPAGGERTQLGRNPAARGKREFEPDLALPPAEVHGKPQRLEAAGIRRAGSKLRRDGPRAEQSRDREQQRQEPAEAEARSLKT